MKTSIVSRLALALVAGIWALPSWATLVPRYFDGDSSIDAYYDDVLHITWLADANAGAGSAWDNGGSTTDGRMTWANANAWAGGLTLGGATEWRLPSIVDTGSSGCNWAFAGTDCGYNVQTKSGTLGVYEVGQTVYSEMAHMFYVTLGNDGYYDAGGSPTGCAGSPDYCLTNRGVFPSLKPYYYWSGTAYAPSPDDPAWYFDFNDGHQSHHVQSNEFYAWAVHSGDVGAAAPVPIPAAAWLFGSGLVGLLGIGRRRRLALR